jgi:transporter family protein
MSWVYWAIITAVLYGLFDFFVKKTAGKVEDGLAAFIYNVVSIIIVAAYLLFAKYKGLKFFATSEGLTYNIIGGIIIGLASLTYIKVFSSGANLTTGVAIVRIGMVILATLLGLFLLQEKLILKQIIGIFIALFGLFLVLVK